MTQQALAPTGTLRASINLGNSVLAQGSPEDPQGVTVQLAQAIAAWLSVPVRFLCFDAARMSFDALANGDADLSFLAIDPDRAEQVAFTAPYAVIDGVFVVPEDSPITGPNDLDRPGLRIGVRHGSAYDLYLTRTLLHAELVRGDEGVDVYLAEGCDAGAGIRQPVERFAAEHPGQRVIEERFMQIRQAVAVPRSVSPEALAELDAFVERLKANGSVAEWLHRSGQDEAAVVAGVGFEPT